MPIRDRWVVCNQQFTASTAHVGVKNGGEQRQLVTAAVDAFGFVFIDMPVEIIVGVAPPLDPCPVRGERGGQGQRRRIELAIDRG